MEDFTTRTYGTSGLDNRPLFGETSAKVSTGGGPPGPECACPASLQPTWAWSELGSAESWSCSSASLLACLPCTRLQEQVGGEESSESSGQLVGSPSRECGNPAVEGDSCEACTTALWSCASGVR